MCDNCFLQKKVIRGKNEVTIEYAIKCKKIKVSSTCSSTYRYFGFNHCLFIENKAVIHETQQKETNSHWSINHTIAHFNLSFANIP